jgi:hypothetical protein
MTRHYIFDIVDFTISPNIGNLPCASVIAHDVIALCFCFYRSLKVELCERLDDHYTPLLAKNMVTTAGHTKRT